jgi:hypothetical protein
VNPFVALPIVAVLVVTLLSLYRWSRRWRVRRQIQRAWERRMRDARLIGARR